jgi:hypothetical protein
MSASIGSAGKAMARPWSCGRGQRRPGRVGGVFGAAVALALALAGCTPAQPSSSAAAGGSQPAVLPGMSCAWPDRLRAQADNTAFADAAEEYFWQQEGAIVRTCGQAGGAWRAQEAGGSER